MSSNYFSPSQTPPTWLVATILAAMLLLLLLVPSLAFANQEDQPPRHLVSPEDIASKVAAELSTMGYGDLIEAKVQTDDPNTMFGADEPITVDVSSLSASSNKKWTANIIFKNGDKILTALPMKGQYDEMVELPVLSRPLASGQIVTADDVTIQTFPIHYQRGGVVVDAQEIIGKAARRNISVDRPIRTHEVSTPMVVKEDDLVSLIYKNSSLSITTTGQVLADAAVGDVVAVKNVNSDKAVRAVIQEDKSARVMPVGQSNTVAMKGDSHEYN